MQIEQVDNDGGAFLAVLAPGEELISSLESFANEHAKGRYVNFTGVGAISHAHLLAFDFDAMQYQDSVVLDDQAEIAALTGNIGEYDGGPLVHAHLVIGRRDGTALGGHVKTALIRPTCEITLFVHDSAAVKRIDPDWHAPLYKLTETR